ncbi:TonB-dependent receptor [Chryseobacterium contaminans]|uniref:Outer membrane protein beta-barrel family protein n=1 Tax=Chryseobacterium contaminans TaxID=1423959 RepID=A0A1M7HGE1_9FLAO|nr:TonB-dependent receptor [Chryseobacterium contaminans]OCA78537.1 TonB-dependent receptor [Chryseobacterium contaminans]SHM27601.1 Outer membrane protein beta-barrel family protein [Chryseobacterium contaminans]
MKKTLFAISLVSSVLTFAQEKGNNSNKEKQIDGIVITKTKKAVEQKADRTIFDFSEQPQLNNGNVLEGIKKLPGLVATDIAGMMYQGKMLDVYLNGRPLNITSNELNSFLESMPANSIERIEVVTQPGAEFPATSGGAVMNIITNKNANKYLSATYSGNYTFTNYDKYRSRTTNSVNLNARNKYFGWQLNVGQNYRESMMNTQQDDLLNGNTDRFARTYFAKTGVTFDLGQDRLLLNYDIYHNNNDNYTLSDGKGDRTYDENSPNKVYIRDYTFGSSDAARTNTVRQEAVVTYQKRFSDKSQKLDFQLGYTKAYTKFGQDNIFFNKTFEKNSTLPEQRLPTTTLGNVLSNNSDMKIANFKVDYSQPIKLLDGGKVSGGGLYERQDYDTESKGLKNLEYQRQTASTYLEFQAKLKKFDFTLGSRFENYDISGVTRYFDKDGKLVQTDLLPFNKFKFFPNASIQYNLMNQVYVAANYNKKISLPSISALNPNNTTFGGPNTQITGNANLQPTIFDNYELKISAFDYAFIGYSVSSASNQVAQIIRKDGRNLYNEQINISNMKIHNFNIGLPVPFQIFTKSIGEIMKSNFNPDKMNFMYIYAGYQKHEIDNLNNKGFWILNLMTQLILPKDIKLTANYSYLTPKAGYFYFTAEKPFSNNLDITLTKKFMNNRLTVSVFANDIFNGQIMQVRSNPPSGENVMLRTKYDSRNFGISINYKIPTRNKLAKEDPNILNQTKKEDNGGVMQQGQQ